MKKILIISTGGTFNKIYNPKNGLLEIDKKAVAIKDIASSWLCKFEIVNIIGKDSLDMTNEDREKLCQYIEDSFYQHIIIVHGTDTIDATAQYIYNKSLNRLIILTGSMIPYSINPVEPTANLSMAYGFLNNLEKKGVYISMNGIVDMYHRVKKNQKLGKFVLIK